MNLSFHLYQLQKIDTRLDQIETRLIQIENILSDNEQVKQATILYHNAQLSYRAAQQALTDAEYAVKVKRIKIEQSESMLYSGNVKNPKELQDIQNEITSLKRNLITLEDLQLEAMVEMEEEAIKAKTQEEQLAEIQAKVNLQNSSLITEKSELLKNREKYNLERQAISAQVTPDSMSIYARLRQTKKGTVVATIDDDACSVCGSEVSPGERQAARSPSKIVFCAFCGRILYAG